MEAHVCVLSTAADLLDRGNDVFVLCDAVSSQRQHDRCYCHTKRVIVDVNLLKEHPRSRIRHVALQRLSKSGAVMSTVESCAMELLQTSEHSNFKQIAQLLKLRNGAPRPCPRTSTSICACVHI